MIVDCEIPDEYLIIMVKRAGEIIIPYGSTTLYADDILVVTGEEFGKFYQVVGRKK